MFCPAAPLGGPECGKLQSNGCVHPSRTAGVRSARGQRDCGPLSRASSFGRGHAPIWPPRELLGTEEQNSHSQEANFVVKWMENEVVLRLLRLDSKVEKLAGQLTWLQETAGGASGSSARLFSKEREPMQEFCESSWRRKAAQDAAQAKTTAAWINGGLLSGRNADLTLPLPHGDMLDVDGPDPRREGAREPFPSDTSASSAGSTTCTAPKGVKACGHGFSHVQEEAAEQVPGEEGYSLEKAEAPVQEEVNPSPRPPRTESDDRGSVESMKHARSLTGRISVAPAIANEILAKRTGNRSHILRLGVNPGSFERSNNRNCRAKLWSFLDDPESSKAASWYHFGISVFIMISVGIAILQTIEPPILTADANLLVEVIVEALFALELLLRFIVCPNQFTFLKSWCNLIDIVAVAPLAIRAALNFQIPESTGDNLEDLGQNMMLVFVPVLRLMRTIRRFERFKLLIISFELCVEALPICLFSLAMLTLVFSALIFLVEPRDNISSLPQAMWLTMVTMTTVGYGDITPESGLGSCVVAVLVISSVLYMAMPLGIIGQAFTQTWAERDKVLLQSLMKDRLRQWGYKAADMPILFGTFDLNADGSLNEMEFLGMVKEMQLGLSEQRARNLFKSFDVDGSGTIEDREFIEVIFPGQWEKVEEAMATEGLRTLDPANPEGLREPPGPQEPGGPLH